MDQQIETVETFDVGLSFLCMAAETSREILSKGKLPSAEVVGIAHLRCVEGL